jgi:hypothetical protein
MGSPSNEDGRYSDEQRHSVRLTQAFWMAETEVTQGQWLAVMQAEPRGGFHSANKGAEVAANTLSWTEAMDFCRRLTEQEQRAGRLPQGFAYTLPTEAQWEYACRAGTRTPFSFDGDQRLLGQYAVYEGSRDGEYAHRGKSRKPNPWGFYDMHGNVWEWCLDSWGGGEDTYLDGITDPLAQGGPRRVNRGGGWAGSPAFCRSASRYASDPSGAYDRLGFRPVLALGSSGMQLDLVDIGAFSSEYMSSSESTGADEPNVVWLMHLIFDGFMWALVFIKNWAVNGFRMAIYGLIALVFVFVAGAFVSDTPDNEEVRGCLLWGVGSPILIFIIISLILGAIAWLLS